MVAGGGCIKCVKYLLFFFNLLFVITGLSLIIVGAVAVAEIQYYSTFGPNSLTAAGVVILVIGGIILIIALFGCFGALNENNCLLTTFTFLMVFLLVLSIVELIIAFVYRTQVYGIIINAMNDSIPLSYKSPDIKNIWDNVQRRGHCCGAYNVSDWTYSAEIGRSRSVPDSCCQNETYGCGYNYLTYNTTTSVWLKPCGEKVVEKVSYRLWIVGFAAVVVSILMVIGLLLAAVLSHAIRNDYASVK